MLQVEFKTVTYSRGSSDSIPDAGLTFMQMIEELDSTYFSVTSTMQVRQCIEDIHSWLVIEVMKVKGSFLTY